MSATDTRTLQVFTGAAVITMDGQQVGRVKEVRGQFFKVDAPRARDYWLTLNEVLSADENQTLLVIPRNEINVYKLSRPGRGIEGSMAAGAATAERDRSDPNFLNR